MSDTNTANLPQMMKHFQESTVQLS